MEDPLSDEIKTKKKTVSLTTILISFLVPFLILGSINIFLLLNPKEKTKKYLVEQSKPVESSHIIPIKQTYYDNDRIAGAAALQYKNDILLTEYYSHIDIYNLKNSDRVTILEKFKTYQQTTDYTCGCSSAIMAIYYITNGKVIGERDCADITNSGTDIKKNSHDEMGVWPQDLNDGIKKLGYQTLANSDFEGKELPFHDYESFEKFVVECIKQKSPIIVLSNDWGGHYTVIIGVDTMGTERLDDDVLIIADPYDSADHVQDGYVIWNLEKFFDLFKVPVTLISSDQNASQFIVVKNTNK